MDKLYHTLVCFVIVFVTALFLPLWLSVLIACFASVAKEVYDLENPDKHSAEWADLIADGVGILLGISLSLTLCT